MVHVRLGAVHSNSLKNRQTASLLLTGLMALGIGMTGHYYLPSFTRSADALIQAAKPVVDEIAESEAVQVVANTAAEVQDLASEAAAVVAEKPQSIARVVELGEGRTFARMLMDAAIPTDQAMAASNALTDVYDHRKLKAGQEMTLSITRLGEEQTLTGLTFEPASTQEVSIIRQAGGTYIAQLRNTPVERKRFAAKGEITSSLYAAGEHEGVPRAIMAALIRAYSHKIDFQRDLHRGDYFEVLYDQSTARDGSSVGQGVIIYAALIIDGKANPIYRVTFGDGTVDYFDERGRSVKRSLLRTPVEGARVTSRFGMRTHPLLGYSKMHKGIDFGASTGTPIYASGSGVIEKASYYGSYGRYVRIRHNTHTQTAYAHMSRFASGIRPGVRVKQGDVIGFVGTSGRSTGPHLHYEVVVNGRQINPMNVNMQVGRSLDGKTLKQFKNGQTKINQEYRAILGQKPQSAEQGAPSPLASIKVAAKR